MSYEYVGGVVFVVDEYVVMIRGGEVLGDDCLIHGLLCLKSR